MEYLEAVLLVILIAVVCVDIALNVKVLRHNTILSIFDERQD